jgi:hypothetical protein
MCRAASWLCDTQLRRQVGVIVCVTGGGGRGPGWLGWTAREGVCQCRLGEGGGEGAAGFGWAGTRACLLLKVLLEKGVKIKVPCLVHPCAAPAKPHFTPTPTPTHPPTRRPRARAVGGARPQAGQPLRGARGAHTR